VLRALVIDNTIPDLGSSKQELQTHCAFFGEEPDDSALLQFLNMATEALDEFRRAPKLAVTSGRLHSALDLLRRSSLINLSVTEAIASVIGERAVLEIMSGPVRTWMHRTLESIAQERQLQHIILRLEQASIPKYAQVLHGPLEYGKDIVVAFEIDGDVVLRMYQAKCGDINTEKWIVSSHELERMFLVPLSDFQIGAPVIRREGVLVTNGHALPHTQPVIEGWFEEQRRVHGWELRFMHLDRLVEWVLESHLVNELTAALGELGIPILTGGSL
jgi:hypothetical protein